MNAGMRVLALYAIHEEDCNHCASHTEHCKTNIANVLISIELQAFVRHYRQNEILLMENTLKRSRD